MRNFWWLLVLGASLACGAGSTGTDETLPVAQSPAEVIRSKAGNIDFDAMESVPGRYIVKLKNGASVDSSGKVFGGSGGLNRDFLDAKLKKVRTLTGSGDTISVEAEGDVDGLGSSEDVEWIEPVRQWKVMGGLNDPDYRYQWNMQALRLDEVYARTQGKGVIVAVIDSGVSPGPDGPQNMVAGRDVVDNDNDARDSAASQSSSGSHGTHVAGTIAETGNNGVGVAGVAPQASIMPVRVGDYGGVYSDDIAEGITWAVDHGAQVLNISIGGYSSSRAVQEACKKAYDKGVVVVAASGNDGYDDRVAYPGAYDGVIAVGAHDAQGKETSYSNRGPELALLAPGGDTPDTNGDGKPDGILQQTVVGSKHSYALMSGTSMASPHVAAAAALLIASGLSGPEEVRNALLNGAKTVNGVRMLDIMGALDQAGRGGGPPVAGTTPRKPGAGGPGGGGGAAPGGPGGGGPGAGGPGAGGPGAGEGPKAGAPGGGEGPRAGKSGPPTTGKPPGAPGAGAPGKKPGAGGRAPGAGKARSGDQKQP